MTARQQQKKFLTLYEPVHDRFERFCRARVFGKMDYQDLMNESLLVAYQKLDSLQSEQAFLSFLIGISRRLLANQHRKKSEDTLHQLEEQDQLDVNANAERDIEVYLLHQALATLPEEQRESLILFEITGFSIKEIAALHQASESAVKQRLKRGRAQLTKILTFESEHKTTEVNNGTA